ncbi:MAG: Efflux transporter, family, subunit [Rickettsiaceae bacterium]|jgi:RND family efflux transporter MFP subunit|nr:Efflux transporter, family, subunit [Rickettsiaceae bacterium]
MFKRLFTYNFIFLLTAIFTEINSSFASPFGGPVLVETQKVEKKQLNEIFKTVGRVENVNSKNFFSKVEGNIDIRTDKMGGEVKKGDLLLAINYNIAETIKSQADLNYKIAKAKYEKDQKLFKNNVITEDGLNKSKLEFEAAKLSLEKVLETYSNMVIRAPFDGRLGIIKQNLDESVKPGDFLFTIVSSGFKEVIMPLPQRLYNQTDKDTKVYLIDDYKKPYPATIVSISPYISKETGNFDAKLELEDNENRFLHGAYTDIEVIYGIHDALVLPEKALLRDEKGSFVYIIKDNKASKQYLKLGTKTDGLVEIINSEVTAEDEIVIEGLTKVYDGSEVTIKTNDKQTE